MPHSERRKPSLRRRFRRARRHARTNLTHFRYSRWGAVTRYGLLAVGGLAVLGVLWVVVTAFLARRQLGEVDDRISEVRTLVAQGQLDDARTVAKTIPGLINNADRLTSGPAWWVGAHLPYVGEPLEVARGTTGAAKELGDDAIPRLVDVAARVNPAELRADGSTIRTEPLVQALPDLQSAQKSLQDVTTKVRALPSDTWLGPINRSRVTLLTQLSSIQGYVVAADRAARVLPVMLGDDGRTRRYFIGLQNESEMRGTGGLPGAFAIASTRNGKITFERFESDSALLPGKNANQIDTGLDFGRSYDELYGSGRPTQEFNDSNVSPNFPYAARIWAAMWEKQYHQHIDGAVALDPTALAYFLTAVGRAKVPQHGYVDATNVVSLTQRDAYALFPDNKERKAFLVAVLKATSKKLTSGSGKPLNLVEAASRAAGERRLLAWSADPAVQKLLEQTTYAGDISGTTQPLTALILNNSAAGKLDYYLQRSVNYSRTGCGPNRDVNVVITLLNTAPRSGLSPYVTTRLDAHPPADAKPGDSRTTLDYYATGGAQLQSVMVNGRPSTANLTDTLGRTVVRLDVELPVGEPQTIELHLQEPAGKGVPLVWVQPGVNPLASKYQNQTCG